MDFQTAATIGGGLGSMIGGYFISKKGAHKGASEGASILNGASERLKNVERQVGTLNETLGAFMLSNERRLTRAETRLDALDGK